LKGHIMTAITIKIPDDLAQDIKRIIVKHAMTQQGFIVKAIENAIRKLEDTEAVL
jgi:predicted transcriptional regulator